MQITNIKKQMPIILGLSGPLLVFLFMFSIAGCEQPSAAKNNQTDQEGAEKKKTEQKKSSIDKRFVVPNAAAAELLKYIDKINSLRPDHKGTDEEFKRFQENKRAAILEAAKRILQAKPNLEQKITGFSIIYQLEDVLSDARIKEFFQLFQDSKSLESQVKLHELSLVVLDNLGGKDATDENMKRLADVGAKIVGLVDATFQEKLTAEQQARLTNRKLNMLEFLTGTKGGSENLRKYAISLFKHKDKELALAAFQVVLNSRFTDNSKGDEKAMANVPDDFKAWLDVNQPSEQELGMAAQLVQALEHRSNIDSAIKLRDLIIDKFSGLKNEELKKAAEAFKKEVSVHLDLIGQKATIEGRLLDGSEFDWKKFRGKVVLIDFWATWCRPCVELFPELQGTYAKYNSRGFEVVGISLDTNDERLVAFLDRAKLPWTIVSTMTGEKKVARDPNAERYHANAIPLLLLVDQKGTIVSVGTHGKKLEQWLEKLLPKKKKPPTKE